VSERKAVGDMKAGLTGSKPKMTLVGHYSAVHQVRGTEYGAAKYARGNYYGPAPKGVSPVDRFLGYIDAEIRHLLAISNAINVAKGTGGDQVAACSVIDDESSGGFPASGLPHISHAIAGLGIAIECAVADGLIPADPGQPWTRDPLYAKVLERRAGGALATLEALAQKADPDAERRRVESLAIRECRPVAVKAEVEALDKEIADGFADGFDAWPGSVPGVKL
jgi:hypothetical protein